MERSSQLVHAMVLEPVVAKGPPQPVDNSRCGAAPDRPSGSVRPLQLHQDVEPADAALPGMVGNAPAMIQLGQWVRKMAWLPLPVLLRGESGSGKDLVAQALHRCGERRQGPFVAINGATVPDNLGASVLFGHAKGAFTGASTPRLGAFRQANGGTLFLDEVASLSAQVQAALLRVVEDGQVQPMGADRTVPVDVRLVTATCEPLVELVDSGQFRSDLYQRLTGCVLRVPPLREHLTDMRPLSEHLLKGLQMGVYCLADEAIEELRAYPFPGNVRELRNVLAQAALCCEGTTIGAVEVAAVLDERAPHRPRRLRPAQAATLLARAKGNVSAAARRAGMPRSTFRDLLRAAR